MTETGHTQMYIPL